MDSTTKGTNAYVVYSTPLAARKAVSALNGSMILDRHLRVDGVAHPSPIDHRRCIFVGNLGFVDDESNIKAAEDEAGNKKPRRSHQQPADVEEGLWRTFNKCGKVESVRVVRDKVTRVGKGFAYVQFDDQNGVEAALQYNDQKFPPMLPRKLRVTRAKSIKKTATYSRPAGRDDSKNKNKSRTTFGQKPSAQSESLKGRAGKLLGRAGAAAFNFKKGGGRPERRSSDGQTPNKAAPTSGSGGIIRTPESFVFEGYRASKKEGKPRLGRERSEGKSKKRVGKPAGRSSRRGAAFKRAGGKKTGAKAAS